jgi:hypothetical protein
VCCDLTVEEMCGEVGGHLHLINGFETLILRRLLLKLLGISGLTVRTLWKYLLYGLQYNVFTRDIHNDLC